MTGKEKHAKRLSSFLSPLRASLFITITAFRHYQVSIGSVYSIHDSTDEVTIQKMIDASQRMIDVQSQVQGEAAKEDGWELTLSEFVAFN